MPWFRGCPSPGNRPRRRRRTADPVAGAPGLRAHPGRRGAQRSHPGPAVRGLISPPIRPMPQGLVVAAPQIGDSQEADAIEGRLSGDAFWRVAEIVATGAAFRLIGIESRQVIGQAEAALPPMLSHDSRFSAMTTVPDGGRAGRRGGGRGLREAACGDAPHTGKGRNAGPDEGRGTQGPVGARRRSGCCRPGCSAGWTCAASPDGRPTATRRLATGRPG